MNPIKEAAIAAHEAEKAHPGLRVRMDVSHKYVHVTADLGDMQLCRTVSWLDIEQARINTLTATIALVVNQITSFATT